MWAQLLPLKIIKLHHGIMQMIIMQDDLGRRELFSNMLRCRKPPVPRTPRRPKQPQAEVQQKTCGARKEHCCGSFESLKYRVVEKRCIMTQRNAAGRESISPHVASCVFLVSKLSKINQINCKSQVNMKS